MPTNLYLNEPGSRWELADEVDAVDLRRQLDGARFGSLETEVIVDGLRGPLIIRHDLPVRDRRGGGNAPGAAPIDRHSASAANVSQSDVPVRDRRGWRQRAGRAIGRQPAVARVYSASAANVSQLFGLPVR